MLKRFAALGLGVVLILAACGVAPDAPGQASPGQTVEELPESERFITVLAEGGSPEQRSVEAMADEFKSQTGYEVRVAAVPYVGLYDRLVSEITAPTGGIDVAAIDVVWLPVAFDHIVPLDDLFTDEVRADLFPHLVESATRDGSLYGMPIWDNAEILMYRTDLFEDPEEMAGFEAEFGYELAPPQTWDELRDVANWFTRDTDGDGVVDLYGTNVEGGAHEDALTNLYSLAAQAGAEGHVVDDEGNVIVDSEPYVAAAQFLVDLLHTDQVAPPAAAELLSPNAVELFQQGRLATMVVWGHFYTSANDPEASTVSGNVGTAPNTQGEAGIAATPGPWYHVVLEASTKQDIAKQFVQFMYENNQSVMDVFGVAARRSVFDEYAEKEGFEHLDALAETLESPSTFDRPALTQWAEIGDQVMVPTLQSILLQEQTPADALTEARTQIEDMLAE